MNLFKTILISSTCALLLSILSIISYHHFFLKKKEQVFIVNSELFDRFKGTDFLKSEMQKIRENNQNKIDSATLLYSYDDPNFQKLFHELKDYEQNISQKYTENIWQNLNQYVADYAKEKDLDVVFGANGSGVLMYADSMLNKTDEVVQYVNSKYEGN